jgi:hypothetical protein
MLVATYVLMNLALGIYTMIYPLFVTRAVCIYIKYMPQFKNLETYNKSFSSNVLPCKVFSFLSTPVQ